MIISKRLFLGFAIIIGLAVIVGVIGITGMNRLRETSRSIYESQVLGLEYAGKAAATFKQVRLNVRQVVINSLYDDLWGSSETKDAFEASADDFRYWLERGMDVAATDELTRFYVQISDVFENSFMPKAEILFDESIRDIPDHTETLYVNVLLESIIETGEELEAMVIGSIDLNTALVQQANNNNNRFTQIFIGVQTILLFAAVMAAVFIALYITKSITVPINEAANILSKVARGDFEARVKGEYKGELALIKNSVNQTAEQLYKYLKEKVQEEKTRNLSAILSIAEAGILIKDKNGLIADWNVGAEKILGYTHDEVIGKSTKILSPESIHHIVDKIQEQQKRGEHTSNSEDVRIHKDGRMITCSASQTPLFDEDGNFSGSVVIFHDVTEKKLAEQEVKRFASIIESADACIITTDKDLVIQGWNSGAENILGYTAQEIIGKTPYFFSPESEWDKVADINRRILSGERISRTDVLQKHKNGTILDCSVYYSAYFNADGSFDGAVAVLHDISERKKMERELQEALQVADEASRVKSNFLANMSHEIRTPMNAVISMTELLLEEKLTPKQHGYLMDIKVSGANLLGIINDILDFSKIESGKFEIMPVHFDLALMLRNLYSTFEFVARDKGLRFVSQMEEDTPKYLFGDDIRIRQILVNLLSNAVKFTESGQVLLKTHGDEHNIYFNVSDTGIGVKKESISKLFDSFQQFDASANRTKTGTGLGLPITKSLIELMGGTITVDSEYGVGTTFYVAIPRVDGDPDQLKTDLECNAITLHAPEALVLVVDDYEANLRVATGLLNLHSINCDTASDGATALEMVRKKKYDLVFMDHMMPGMDGVETMLHIREIGFDTTALPIVALTANAISGVKEMLIEQGMNDFLSKPIDRKLLAEILVKWLPEHKVHIQKAADHEASTEEISDKKESDFIQSLRSVPEINIDSALESMGGLEDLYESTFMIVHRKLPENISKLDAYLEKDSLHDFAVEVHGLKGALNNIGYWKLGDYAANLEKASKEENKDYCRSNYPDFKGHVLEFQEKAALIIDSVRQDDKKDGDIAFFRERLAAVGLACEEYDSFAAYEILTELTQYVFSAETDTLGALMENALQAAENCDYDGVLDIISQIQQLFT